MGGGSGAATQESALPSAGFSPEAWESTVSSEAADELRASACRAGSAAGRLAGPPGDSTGVEGGGLLPGCRGAALTCWIASKQRSRFASRSLLCNRGGNSASH